MEESNNTTILSSEEDENGNTEVTDSPRKKFRVSAAAVHLEFEQIKNNSGVWTSRCKHCLIKETVYKHKNCSALLVHLEKKHPAIHKNCLEKDLNERKMKEKELKGKEHQVQIGESSKGRKTTSQAIFSSARKEGGVLGPMDRFTQQTTKQPMPDWKRKRIEQKYAFWLGASGLPVSAVTEDPHFEDFIRELNPDVKLPSRGKVVKDCSVLSDEVKDRIRNALFHAKKVSVTVDIWSSAKCKNSYMGVTVHLFNHETKKRESYVIACRRFDVAHTGDNISRVIQQILIEYNIESKVFYCLSDNGSNMKKGLRLLGEGSDIPNEEFDDDCWDNWEEEFESDGVIAGDDDDTEMESEDDEEREEGEIQALLSGMELEQEEHVNSFAAAGLKRLGCFPHTMQLAIIKSFKKRNAMGTMLKKSRKLVVKYRRSSKAKSVLQKTKFKKRLLGYCKTRWWTDNDMIKRLREAKECEQVPGPLEILVDTMEWPQKLMITDRDLEYMKAYNEMMELIKEKSDQLGAENLSTMHLIYPSLMELIAHLEEKSKKAICKTISSDLKKNMKSYFNYMMDPLDSNFDPIVITATYLSPVHRHILNEEQVQVAEDHVKDLLRTYDEDEQDVRVEDGHGVGGEEQETTITIPGLKFLSKTILQTSNNANSDPAAALKRDLDHYKIQSKKVLTRLMKSANLTQGEAQGEMKTCNPTDPMDFWVKELKSYQFESPLASLALDIMAIPASSVPSERLFSISGLLSSGLNLMFFTEKLEFNICRKAPGDWPNKSGEEGPIEGKQIPQLSLWPFVTNI